LINKQPNFQQLLSDVSEFIEIILKIRVAGRDRNAVNDISHFAEDVAS